ncbi:zinc ribbon domain-containing protein [Zavarzinella formosa]|uniref:hypothetical protein n=1 Tax=Zavarzinella formosa TaxID=360055 RepID=UPI00031EB9AD|nr:hypothetical protein [Zavarzinella formosa]
MTVMIQCPACENTSNLPDEHLGKKIRCKNCQNVFVTEKPKARAKPPELPKVASRKSRDVEEELEEEDDAPRMKKAKPPVREDDDEEDIPRKGKAKSALREDDDEEEEEERPRKKKKKKKKQQSSNTALLIGIGLLFFLAALGGAFYMVFGSKSDIPQSVDAKASEKALNPAPVIPPQDLKTYTIWDLRIKNNSSAPSGKSLNFNYQDNQKREAGSVINTSSFVIVIVAESGEKFLMSSSYSEGNTMHLYAFGIKSGSMSMKIPTARPAGKSKKAPDKTGDLLAAIPNLGKNPKVYVAERKQTSGNDLAEGERISNIADLKVE